MAESVDQLEKQALALEKAGNVADALDLYEEIDRRGAATAQHLVQLGNCLLKSRQRQNAMDTWFRVLQMQPNYPPAVEALNQYFPNWEGRFEKFVARGSRVTREATPPPRPLTPAAHGEDPPPPPPPPPSATATTAPKVSLTVENVVQPPRQAPPRPAPAPRAAPTPAEDYQQQPPRPAAPQPVHSGHTGHAAQYSDAAEVSEEDIMDSRVNWKYILADAQEEAAANA